MMCFTIISLFWLNVPVFWPVRVNCGDLFPDSGRLDPDLGLNSAHSLLK